MKLLFVLFLLMTFHQYSDGIRCYRCVPRANDSTFCASFGRNRRDMEQVDCPKDNKCVRFIGDTIPTSTGPLAIRGCPSDDVLASFPKNDSMIDACFQARSTEVSFLPRHQFQGELCYCSTDECNLAQSVPAQGIMVSVLISLSIMLIANC